MPGPVRTLSVDTDAMLPPMIIVLDIIAAPALVPARIMPSASRACSAVSTLEPPMTVVMRSWSPPVKKTPVACSIAETAGRCCCPRDPPGAAG